MKKHKVLCIDDEAHNLESLERLLRKEFEVHCVESGALGIEKLKENQFSLIISDQKMPEMTGVQFFEQAKQFSPHSIRILLTGYTDLESVISAINRGNIYRYVTKPWDTDELTSIVNQSIDVFNMRQTIEDQNEQLRKANAELQSLDQLKTEFMLLVNHELKTPLTGIYSFLQLLLEEDLSDSQSLYLDKINQNTQRLQNLIEDILLIVKLKARSSLNSQSRVDLVSVVKKVETQLAKQFKDKNMHLELGNLSSFEQQVDSQLMETLIGKLLHNAFQHGKSGSTIHLEFQTGGTHWQMATTNPMEKPMEGHLDDYLEAFNKPGSILNHSGGSGLGLAVIKSILNLFKGDIQVSSDQAQFKAELRFPL